MKVCIIGLGGEVPFKDGLGELVRREFGCDACFLKAIRLNMRDYDEGRGQYDAERLLASLARPWRECGGEGRECGKILGVVSEDMFVPRLNFVFGLSEMGGREGVVSFARLKDENEEIFRVRFLKEALHELGHLFGLGHCTNGKCVMKFSNSLHEVDLKGGEFCGRCGKRMIR